jgi:putative spermidine/putrescine transport system permease protein
MSQKNTKNSIFQVGALLGPATILVTLMFIIPLIYFLRNSFNFFVSGELMKPGWTLESYIKFFHDPYFLKILWRTIYIAFLSTVISLILGFPMAYMLARTRSRFKSFIIMLIVFPLLIGNIIRDIGWLSMFSESGLINKLLLDWGLIHHPIQFVNTPLAVIIGITNVVLPYMILTLQSVLERIDLALEEAAYDLGASRFTVTKSILLPLAMPGILVGTLFVFVLSMNAYTTPLIIGGPHVKMMAPELYSQITQVSNWPMGATMAVILIVVTLAMSGVYYSIMRKFTVSTSGTEVKG